MSQDFRQSLNKMLESNPTTARKENGIEYHKERGYNRAIKFILADGRQIGLSYHNLTSTEFEPGNEAITLEFTTYKVLLKGKNLAALHDEFLQHGPKIVEAGDERYNLLVDGLAVVNTISIFKQG